MTTALLRTLVADPLDAQEVARSGRMWIRRSIRTNGVALLAAAGLLASGCGSDGDTESSSNTEPTEGPSAPAAPAKTADLSELEGTWRFTFADPKLDHGTGRMASATVTKKGERILVTGETSTTSEFGPNLSGDLPVRCTGDTCSVQGATGFKVSDGAIKVVNLATLEPLAVRGPPACAATALPDVGVVKDFDGNSFTYLDGKAAESGAAGSGTCYQVTWTVVATQL